MERKRLEPLPIEFEQGNCRQLGVLAVSVMYPEEGDRQAEAIAKSVCEGCPVQDSCLDRAIKHKEMGVWGGHTAAERNNIVRKRYKNASRKNQIRTS